MNAKLNVNTSFVVDLDTTTIFVWQTGFSGFTLRYRHSPCPTNSSLAHSRSIYWWFQSSSFLPLLTSSKYLFFFCSFPLRIDVYLMTLVVSAQRVCPIQVHFLFSISCLKRFVYILFISFLFVVMSCRLIWKLHLINLLMHVWVFWLLSSLFGISKSHTSIYQYAFQVVTAQCVHGSSNPAFDIFNCFCFCLSLHWPYR